MRKFLLSLLLVILPSMLFAAPPTRSFTYTDGAVIEPSEVTQNEDNIYNYLTRGVDTLASDSVATLNIVNGTIVNADISGSAAIAYSKLTLTDSILSADIASGTIVASDIANTSITYGKLSVENSILVSDISSVSKNTASGIVVLDASSRLPAVDGSLLTGMSSTDYYVGTFTRAMDAASGNVEYAVGFQPQAVQFLAGEDGSFKGSVGVDDGTTKGCFSNTGATTPGVFSIHEDYSISLKESATLRQDAAIASFAATGFTVTWTRVGETAAGTADVVFMAYK